MTNHGLGFGCFTIGKNFVSFFSFYFKVLNFYWGTCTLFHVEKNGYNNKDFITKNNAITLISNNVKGIQTSQKRKKLFEYLKSYIATNGFVFLQEANSSIRDEKKWGDEFFWQALFFSLKSKFTRNFNWLLWNQKIRSN